MREAKMRITEVRIFPKETDDRKLKAFATMTLDDCFVVRDIKIIEGAKGLFVAMPSRRLKESCPRCGHRNVVHSQYCNQCGSKQQTSRQPPTPLDGDETKLRQGEHKDMAHPITLECREYIQKTVLDAYHSHAHQKQMQ